MSWTPDREEKLKELWKKGHTASQIAALIPGTTRNSIIGKAHRLHLQSRGSLKRSTKKTSAEDNIIPDNKQQKLGRKARFKALLLDKNFEPENPKDLLELTDQTCRYPIGHPSEESSFYFCGRRPFEKEVYCRLHLMLCFQPKNAKEEDVLSEEDMPVYEKKIKSA
ncbi:GcrA family cell cycle regulator [Pelagibacteraceae bacterium]|nr:GcrA family cell cycle regulator [Pelagibacteraceae bacterium]